VKYFISACCIYKSIDGLMPYIGFEVLTVVTVECTIIWDDSMYSSRSSSEFQGNVLLPSLGSRSKTNK
jgi:hypothetical protein